MRSPMKGRIIKAMLTASISTLPVIVACAALGATEATAATCMSSPSTCDPYVVTIQQIGPNVVATGSGEFDLTSLPFFSDTSIVTFIVPNTASIDLGPFDLADEYSPLSVVGPNNFGPGGPSGSLSNPGSGAVTGFSNFTSLISRPSLFVPRGYTSGTLLAGQSIFDNTTLAGLGVTPGTYVWTFGTPADQSCHCAHFCNATPRRPATVRHRSRRTRPARLAEEAEGSS
jgi:hypothetical protein